jgi:hypothetical protein
MKSRLAIGLLSLFSVAAARAADIATTLHFSPDLSREANPLSSVLGFDAPLLIASNVILVLLLMIPLHVYVFYGPAKLDETARTLNDYISLQLYRERLERTHLLRRLFLGWPLPRNWLQTTRVVGFALSWAIIFASLQAVFAWWATFRWGMEWYRQYRASINIRDYPVIELIPVIVVLYVMGYIFFRREFNTKNLSKAEQGAASNPLPRGSLSVDAASAAPEEPSRLLLTHLGGGSE